MGKLIDLTGKKFGEWIVLAFSKSKPKGLYAGKSTTIYWRCKCSCGIEQDVSSADLRYGKTTRCSKCFDLAKRTGYMEISGHMWSIINTNARKRGIEINVTLEYIWQLFINQNRKCVLSGLPLVFEMSAKNRTKTTASLDRIDSTKGYIMGNVQWVHKDINFLKQWFTEDYFLYLCNLVVKFHDQKSEKSTSVLSVI